MLASSTPWRRCSTSRCSMSGTPLSPPIEAQIIVRTMGKGNPARREERNSAFRGRIACRDQLGGANHMTELLTTDVGTVEATPATPGRRIPLPVLLAPFAVAAAAGMIADSVWPSLISHHPIVLLSLSSKNRFLLLVAPQVGVLAFFVVGFLRLIF